MIDERDHPRLRTWQPSRDLGCPSGVRFLWLLFFCGWCGCGSSPHALPVAPQPVASPVVAPVAPVSDASAAPAPTPLLAIDWSEVHLPDDAAALALWRRIAPTGADWELRLGELPEDDALLKPLALALLREGGFACPAGSSCAGAGLSPVEATATLSDPCLRRELALWALGRLDEEDSAGLADALVSIVSLPPPEEELVSEAFELVPAGQDALLLRMNQAARAAGHGELADHSLQWLSASALEVAARTMHADGAFSLLESGETRELFVAAIVDTQLRPATRISVMEELAGEEPMPKATRAALRKAAADPSCEVAGAALRLLDGVGDKPRPAPRRSVATAVRALCVGEARYAESHPLDSHLVPLVSPQGLVVIDHAALTEDGGELSGETMPPDQVFVLPFGEELTGALERCQGATCRGPGVRFELAFDKQWRLQRIERFADDSNNCAATP